MFNEAQWVDKIVRFKFSAAVHLYCFGIKTACSKSPKALHLSALEIKYMLLP